MSHGHGRPLASTRCSQAPLTSGQSEGLCVHEAKASLAWRRQTVRAPQIAQGRSADTPFHSASGARDRDTRVMTAPSCLGAMNTMDGTLGSVRRDGCAWRVPPHLLDLDRVSRLSEPLGAQERHAQHERHTRGPGLGRGASAGSTNCFRVFAERKTRPPVVGQRQSVGLDVWWRSSSSPTYRPRR